MSALSIRVSLLALTATAVTLGLLSRTGLLDRQSFLGAYAGDTLWAMMVFFGLVMLLPRLLFLRAIGIALAISYLVEASQLWQAPWLISLRATLVGKLILGRGFLWTDLVCYTIGILIASLLTWVLLRNHIHTAFSPRDR